MDILQVPHARPDVILFDWHATFINDDKNKSECFTRMPGQPANILTLLHLTVAVIGSALVAELGC